MPSFNLKTHKNNSGILEVFLEKMTWNHLEKEPKSLLELFPGFQVTVPPLQIANFLHAVIILGSLLQKLEVA